MYSKHTQRVTQTVEKYAQIAWIFIQNHGTESIFQVRQFAIRMYVHTAILGPGEVYFFCI